MQLPAFGAEVMVYPHPGASVREHPDLPRRLPADGQICRWSQWLHEQHGQGLIHLTDPRGAAPVAAVKE